MALNTNNPTQTAAWQKLATHFEQTKAIQMQQLFAADPLRTEKMHIEWQDFLVDYSKNRVTDETMDLLLALAEEMNLPLLGQIPLVQSIRESGDIGRPAVLQETTPQALAFREMAQNIAQQVAILNANKMKESVTS
jgi:septum formation inhibitor-activating ATPase MinD